MHDRHSPLYQTLLAVRVEDHLLGFRLAEITRLVSLPRLQVVPEAPDELLGLMNLGGEPVPVVDLGVRLGIPRRAAYDLDTPILLTEARVGGIGLVVDEVLGVREVARGAIRPAPWVRDSLPPVLGVVAGGADEAMLLLDAGRVGHLDYAGPLELGPELLELCRVAA